MSTEATEPEASPSSERGFEPAQAVAALEAELAATPRRSRPGEHAAAAYRLGMAYAETPASGGENLSRALACYGVASSIFDPRSEPVAHARVLNAAGAAHRLLGDRSSALSAFERAASLFEGRGRDEERAAALNNLGLIRTEAGQLGPARDAFDEALRLFSADSPEGRRGRLATLHNRGLAHAATGTVDGLELAVADYRAALEGLDTQEAPYHHGLVLSSLGIAATTLAQIRPEQRDEHLREAQGAFAESLTVFTRSDFPYQHALTKHNQGLANVGLGTAQDLRRALACFDDALAVLDPRLHAEAWRQAYAHLASVEARLAAEAPGATRADHFATMVVSCEDEERTALLRERLFGLLALPGERRVAALAEWAQAVVRLGRERARRVIETELEVLVLVPNEALEAVLRAHIEAHRQLGEADKENADRALDDAVGWVLNGPQRVFVRDFLYSLGFVRP
ncbi:MAG: tetratricopeptide repeat protein [Actinomycetota bacterium]|nr:tetratricopeptide repeat protein [Actinomycetota bacterium]